MSALVKKGKVIDIILLENLSVNLYFAAVKIDINSLSLCCDNSLDNNFFKSRIIIVYNNDITVFRCIER